MSTIATECPACPKGIIRCAHFDGRVVWLVEYGLMATHENGWRPKERWGIRGPDTTKQCECSVDHIVVSGLRDLVRADSLPDAEAEFERRAELLRSEP